MQANTQISNFLGWRNIAKVSLILIGWETIAREEFFCCYLISFEEYSRETGGN